MFWKNAKKLQQLKLLYPKRWSIVLQLTALYTCSIVIILFIISSILFLTLQISLHKTGEIFLENEYHLLANLLIKQPLNSESLKQEVILEPSVMKAENRYYVRIVDSNNHNLIETPMMNNVVSHQEFFLLHKNSNQDFTISHGLFKKEPFLLLSGLVKLPNTKSPLQIHIALNIHKETAVLHDYQNMLILVSIIGTLCVTLIGAILARRSMRPIKNIMDTMEQITTKHLHDRLIPSNWPKEFSALAYKLNAMLARLEGSFKRLTQFAADLAHELRTPINNLKGEAEICLTKDRSVSDYKQVLESSLEEYDRLSRMINGLLFLARAEDPQTEVSLSEIHISKIIKAIFEFYTPVAEEQHLTLQCFGDATILADAMLLQRALHNLIANALRYTPVGGSITAHIKTLTIEPFKLQIDITDTGQGIAMEHLPHIFTRFYRADAHRSQLSGGSGLGLAIVKTIMDLHKGEIRISSIVGKGTTVSLIFP
ncbi:heavy metal sensor histidine kinase [soil metagenome]